MLERICQLSREAGAAIMAVYDGEQPLDVAQKNDDSPVTAADLAAHHIIKRGTAALTPRCRCCRKKIAGVGRAPQLDALLAGRSVGRHQRVLAPQR